jgi:hypothetical protein
MQGAKLRAPGLRAKQQRAVHADRKAFRNERQEAKAVCSAFKLKLEMKVKR